MLLVILILVFNAALMFRLSLSITDKNSRKLLLLNVSISKIASDNCI